MMQQQIGAPSQTADVLGNRYSQQQQYLNIPLDIVGSTVFGRYPKISNESTYNMLISDNALVPFAGHELAAVLSVQGNARGAYNSTIPNLIVAVIGNNVVIVNTGYGVSIVGQLDTSNGPVFIADNQAGQIAIVDGLNVYIYNYVANVFQEIVVDFLPVYITYQDGYFICPDGRTNQWRLSQENDGTMWPPDAQHVGQLQSKACLAVGAIALDRVLIIMGQTVCEPWYDAGLQLFPYQRNNSYCIDYGCISTPTIAAGFGLIIWLASNNYSGLALMVSIEGSVPTPISTDGLDFLFAQLKSPQDSFGMLYKLEGHIVYQLTFTTDNHTFLYDFNTQKFFTLTDENLNHHIARKVVYFNNANHFISFNDGNLYKMASTITTYNGISIPRIRIGSNVRFPGADRFIVNNINLTMESGLYPYGAIPASVAAEPINSVSLGAFRIDLNISNDGGYRWGYTITKELRNQGKIENAVNFWKLGAIENDFVWKMRFISQGRFVLTGGTISLTR